VSTSTPNMVRFQSTSTSVGRSLWVRVAAIATAQGARLSGWELTP